MPIPGPIFEGLEVNAEDHPHERDRMTMEACVGQMQKLRAGKHPKTGETLPPPIDCGTLGQTTSLRRYARLDQKRIANQANIVAIDVEAPLSSAGGFTPYVPEPPKVLRPSLGRSAKEKFADILHRVRQREMHNLKRFRLRGKQKPPAAR